MNLPDDIATNILIHAQAHGQLRVVQVIDDSPHGDSIPAHDIQVFKTEGLRLLGCVNHQFARLQRPVLHRFAREAYSTSQPNQDEQLVFVEFKN